MRNRDSAAGSNNTAPEMAVRRFRLLHGMEYRYRLHCGVLPGARDIQGKIEYRTNIIHYLVALSPSIPIHPPSPRFLVSDRSSTTLEFFRETSPVACRGRPANLQAYDVKRAQPNSPNPRSTNRDID